MESKADILKEVTDALIGESKIKAKSLIDGKYPFVKHTIFHRSYTINQKMKIFLRDGFIDRYTDEKLVIPGMLKVLSDYYPESSPYHKNSKMTEGHFAYWEIFPSIDHVIPIATGGVDAEENWATTSMLNNSIKVTGH